ncbi:MULTISPECIES: SRPBCC family protein [unclassified Paracoccus (in: a-proteobacteria)]|uniref:SRPBCC family protein n=1 Tax=unclassified Paracoccus (in: a-proteobacteria) TaxID=2688777 RepID=UPI0012B19235|nr:MULTISPECIES: SRPBCC family protein [unclassified Paracoccus (in: a-proteobacteria)]UXU74465.1 SRPBCC family protein [Paracoccus sp. SMMA_5]UXU80357.1 SRPBCC family protein [Paracoccus sp. SMMA_5_TC]
MKFSTRQDTDLSAEQLFQAISSMDAIERLLTQRGASVRRLADGNSRGLGRRWQIGFDWRGKARDITVEVTEVTVPQTVVMRGQSEQFDVTIRMTVIGLGSGKSRLIFETELLPRNMKARLLLQTAKLGKPKLDARFAERIAGFVNRLCAVGGV